MMSKANPGRKEMDVVKNYKDEINVEELLIKIIKLYLRAGKNNCGR